MKKIKRRYFISMPLKFKGMKLTLKGNQGLVRNLSL